MTYCNTSAAIRPIKLNLKHLIQCRTIRACSTSSRALRMGKNNKKRLDESYLLLSTTQPSAVPIVDTHTHLISTFSTYKEKYPSGKFATVYDFVKGMYQGRNVAALVDVYCEAPVQTAWKDLADSAISPEARKDIWSDISYWFVMGELLCVPWRISANTSLERCSPVSITTG